MHLTADEIHARTAARLPEISRATVYKTLKELVKLGEIREIGTSERAKRYDPNIDARHRHLVCERCGAIRDVYPEGTLNLRLPAREQYGFIVTNVDVVFLGVCSECRDKSLGRRRKTAPPTRR